VTAIDLFQLHNCIALQRKPERSWVGIDDLGPAVQALQNFSTRARFAAGVSTD
jgi:hypothetical protein